MRGPEPKNEDEANAWLLNFLIRYNGGQHRSEPHSRLEDWLQNLPASGLRAMCSWERFCTFARERSITLFIDDAHDLHAKTLVGLNRLIEVVRDGGRMLSIVLAGHPKLKHDLRRPSMEEVAAESWPT